MKTILNNTIYIKNKILSRLIKFYYLAYEKGYFKKKKLGNHY